MKRLCTVEGCSNYARSNASPYCEKHYYRIRRNGSLELKQKEIPESHFQTGGYVLRYAPNHPLTKRHTGPYEYEHRIVYYDANGCGPFKCHWCGKTVTWDDMHVDHLNSIITDNRIENLVASCPICNQHRGLSKMRDTMRSKHAARISYNGEDKTITEWADKLGISKVSLFWRLEHGWPVGRALTETRGKSGPKCHSKRTARGE